MNVTLTPELEERLLKKLQQGEYKDADALVCEALEWFLEADDDGELEETKAAIEEDRAQSQRGEAMPAEEVFAELRARYGIPR